MPKFSKKALSELDEAVKGFNELARKAGRNTISVNDITDISIDVEEIRQNIRMLKDYDTPKDFEVEQYYGIELMKGQIKTLKRLSEVNIRRADRRIDKLEKLKEAYDKLGVESDIEQQLNYLKYSKVNIKNINSERRYENVMKRLLRAERLVHSREIEEYRNNYIKRLQEIEEISGIDLTDEIEVIRKMGRKKFESFGNAHPLKLLYDLDNSINAYFVHEGLLNYGLL